MAGGAVSGCCWCVVHIKLGARLGTGCVQVCSLLTVRASSFNSLSAFLVAWWLSEDWRGSICDEDCRRQCLLVAPFALYSAVASCSACQGHLAQHYGHISATSECSTQAWQRCHAARGSVRSI